MSKRLQDTFSKLSQEGRSALVTFISAGDPGYDSSLSLLKELPGAGADIIELGMPFTDPMADGPAIQASSQRALLAGQNMIKTFEMVRSFRKDNQDTPLVLMGYFNPIYIYGVDRFLKDAGEAGVDGLIVVDLPPEEDEELCVPALKAEMPFIRLATPTTDDKRLPKVLENTSGFLYYVSISGITGTKAPDTSRVASAIERIRQKTDIPIAVGFGVTGPAQAASLATFADGVVVGSALVNIIKDHIDDKGMARETLLPACLKFVSELSDAIKSANS